MKKKVIVFGTFDILHPGHIHMLKEAKEYGNYLVVIVSRDQTVQEVKARPPRHDETTRLQRVEKLRLADKVRLGNLDDKHQVIIEEKPDIVALGYDQKFFIDELENVLPAHARIVRLSPYMPEVYKSSKLAVQDQ